MSRYLQQETFSEDQLSGVLQVAAHSLGCVQLLLRHRAEPTAATLHTACQLGSLEVVEFLLEAGTSLSERSSKGMTALHLAASGSSAGCIHRLVMSGLDPEELDDGGCTALHYAAGEGSTQTIMALLESNARVDTLDQGGCSALHWASMMGHAAAVNVLIREGGADLSLRNEDGASPKDFAGSDSVEELFRGLGWERERVLWAAALSQPHPDRPLTWLNGRLLTKIIAEACLPSTAIGAAAADSFKHNYSVILELINKT
eukprot:CAMPEP_0175901164 /NCGR_PEP_ID=MMETSP0108-20121206/2721_1 /TAXON_ID=195067 ORGANISM="Goniomonas pacifica, Strain CCMP1869" /NCGR_SAMPLE_ID=MMETSP0108 /ASSEMBLY_ACC=CAM_ASM_000204 /LENGTH=258 /DNA_ID=CAMNT_0017222739 /DNA_START=15 /DNA_END=789 /DNA_ORIENTATION=-